MGVETMIEAIAAEAAAEAGRLLAEADRRASAIRDSAQAAVDARVTAACERLEPGFRAEAARMVNAARLKLLERRAERAAERIDAIFRQAGRELGRIADGKDQGRWERALAGLLAEALTQVGEGATISCREVDAVVLRRSDAARLAEVTVEPAPGMPPGLLARSGDGRIEVEATVPVRLARARLQLAEPVARLVGLET